MSEIKVGDRVLDPMRHEAIVDDIVVCAACVMKDNSIRYWPLDRLRLTASMFSPGEIVLFGRHEYKVAAIEGWQVLVYKRLDDEEFHTEWVSPRSLTKVAP